MGAAGVRRAAAGLLVLAAASGCGGRHPPAAPAAPSQSAAVDGRARAAHILASLPGLAPVTGRNDRLGPVTLWQAWFAGPELRLIEERPAGRAAAEPNRYYFERGEFFYYAGEQPATVAGGDSGAAPRASVVVEFRDGQVLRAVRLEHYGEVRLEPEESAAIRARAAELASAARDERSAAALRR